MDTLETILAMSQPERAWREFLESSPPNVPAKIDNLLGSESVSPPPPLASPGPKNWLILLPRLQLHCQTDDGPRLFDPVGRSKVYLQAGKNYEFVTYTCRNCGRVSKVFSLLIERGVATPQNAEVMKLGEFPPFGSPIPKRLQDLLDPENLEVYRQGLRAEAQGLGLGAASYFRRVVENQWKTLVSKMRQAAERLGAEPSALKPFDDALAQTQFTRAVEILRPAIPPKLLILDGQNPLTVLHGPLSVQLHQLTDQECLQQAKDIRLVLGALVENLSDVLKDQSELHEAVKRLRP